MFNWPIYIGMAKWHILVLKGESMDRHPMGPNRMHPDRSSCLGLSANGWMSKDQVLCTFSLQMLRSVYSTEHALGLVPASTVPRAYIVEYLLLSICSEKNWIRLSKYIGKVRGNWKGKTKYITFRNWIMYCILLNCLLSPWLTRFAYKTPYFHQKKFLK